MNDSELKIPKEIEFRGRISVKKPDFRRAVSEEGYSEYLTEILTRPGIEVQDVQVQFLEIYTAKDSSRG